MIKITLHPDTPSSSVRQFHKKMVVIGSNQSSESDISLEGESLKDIHVKLVEQDGQFFVFNSANDPFVTLNDRPFGKKEIKNHDRLTIGNSTVLFEGIPSAEGEEESADAPVAIEVAAPTTVPTHDRIQEQEPTAEDEDEWNEDILSNIDIDAHVREVEQLDHFVAEKQADSEKEVAPTETISENIEKEPVEIQPEQQVCHAENEEPEVSQAPEAFEEPESENWSKEDVKRKTVSTKKSTRLFVTVLSFVFVLTFLIAGGIYINVSEQSDKEEFKVAEGVADVAIALSHTKINRESPQKHHWSDPSFLNQAIQKVISPFYTQATRIGINGQFTDWPFIVRIYTNSNLDHYILIAQPVPSLLHWLVPKKTILLDSETMELRRTNNLKDLNRLLVNLDFLEGHKAHEITAFISQQELIPIRFLAGKKNNNGFDISPSLAKVRPGAENFIYNAPRYHLFGEKLLDSALHLFDNATNSKDIGSLKEQIEFVSQYPDFVFYSSKGKQMALEGLQALTTLVPDNDFLVGYLKLNENGYVLGSRLVDDQSELEFTRIPSQMFQEDEIAEKVSHILEAKQTLLDEEHEDDFSIKGADVKNERQDIDVNHPLFLQMSALLTNRHQELSVLSEEMVDLLNKQNQKPQSQFLMLFQKLLTQYEQVSFDAQQKIMNELLQLNQKYANLPFEEFMRYVKASGMEPYMGDYFIQKNAFSEADDLTSEEFTEYLGSIQNVTNLKDLNISLNEISDLLTIENVPDVDTLITYQNAVRHHTSQKLSQLLLTSSGDILPNAFDEENHNLLLKIFTSAWITDSEEVDFYLNEFDLLSKDYSGE